jgi:hypothetical protein
LFSILSLRKFESQEGVGSGMGRAVPLAVVLWCLVGFAGRSDAARPAPRLAEAEVALAEGLAAFESGKNEEAAGRFAESAQFDPDAGEPHYWRGLALLRLGRPREAAGELEASLAARRPPEVDRARVLSDLEAARRAPEGSGVQVEMPEPRPSGRPIDDRGAWEGSAGLSLASDSNPNLLSQELVLPRPGGKGGLIRGEAADSNARPDVSLGLYPFHAGSGPNLGVSVEGGRSFHQDFGFLDLGEAHGVIQLGFGSDPLGFLAGPLGHERVPFGDSRVSTLLQAGGAVYQVDGASYLRTWEGAGSFTFHERPITATRFDLGYADREFARGGLADARRSGKDLSLQASQLFFFGRRGRYLRLGALGVDRQAQRPFAESIREGNAELALPFALHWTVHLEASVRKDDFAHPESNLFREGGPARDDTTRWGALTVVWAATDRLRLTARGTYVKRASNVDLGAGLPDLDYQRRIASIGMSWAF